MTLDEVLAALFPSGHQVKVGDGGLITGSAKRKAGGGLAVIGVANGEPLGGQGVLVLAEEVLKVVVSGGDTPTRSSRWINNSKRRSPVRRHATSAIVSARSARVA